MHPMPQMIPGFLAFHTGSCYKSHQRFMINRGDAPPEILK